MKKLMLAAALTALAAPAMAADAPSNPTVQMAVAGYMALNDTDKNGKIDHKEFDVDAKRRADSIFTYLDTNHDGVLDAGELLNTNNAMRAANKAPAK